MSRLKKLALTGLAALVLSTGMVKKSNAQCQPFTVDQNTVALWHIDEGIGAETYDATGNYTGNIKILPDNGVPANNLWVPGLFSYAIKNEPNTGTWIFPPTYDYGLNDPSTGTMFLTVEAFVKPETLTPPDTENNFQTIARDNTMWIFGLNSVGKLYVRSWGSHGIEHHEGNSVLSTDKFSYVAFTYNAFTHTLKFYLDGLQDGEDFSYVEAIFSGGGGGSWIGSASGTSTPSTFYGIIDELRISNIERTVTNLCPVSVDNLNLESKLSTLPNPFTKSLGISYSINHGSNINIDVYDLQGRRVSTLVNGYKEAGNHFVNLDSRDMNSGVYFIKFEAGNHNETKRLVKID